MEIPMYTQKLDDISILGMGKSIDFHRISWDSHGTPLCHPRPSSHVFFLLVASCVFFVNRKPLNPSNLPIENHVNWYLTYKSYNLHPQLTLCWCCWCPVFRVLIPTMGLGRRRSRQSKVGWALGLGYVEKLWLIPCPFSPKFFASNKMWQKLGPTMWGPRWIAKLVQKTPITMVYGIYNYSYWGESKPTYILGASHCRCLQSGHGFQFQAGAAIVGVLALSVACRKSSVRGWWESCRGKASKLYPLVIKRGNGKSVINGGVKGKINYQLTINGRFSIAMFEFQGIPPKTKA
jgi:hypothetical protein